MHLLKAGSSSILYRQLEDGDISTRHYRMCGAVKKNQAPSRSTIGCIEPLRVREYLRAARLSRCNALDNVSPRSFSDSEDLSGDSIPNFIQGHFGSELLRMLESLDSEDVSMEVRFLVDCLGTNAEFVKDVFRRKMYLEHDLALEILVECERGMPFDALLSQAWHGAHEHWIFFLLRRTGTIVSEAMVLEVA